MSKRVTNLRWREGFRETFLVVFTRKADAAALRRLAYCSPSCTATPPAGGRPTSAAMLTRSCAPSSPICGTCVTSSNGREEAAYVRAEDLLMSNGEWVWRIYGKNGH